MVSEVLPPDELMPRVLAYAEDMAVNCAPSALAVIKRQIYDDAARNVHDTSATAEKLMHESMLRPDFIEGITAFFEKRQPSFPPLEEDLP
jgi:enoyl-CoA hydratase/carnithine racemase